MNEESAPVTTRVFISYGRNDALDFARRLAQRLRDEGYDAWLDVDNGIAPGDCFDVQIELGIRESDVLLAILSRWSTRDSSFCRNEILYAQAHNRPVIPVLIAAVDRPIQIYTTQYVDVASEGEKALDQVFVKLAHYVEHGWMPAQRQPETGGLSRPWFDSDPDNIAGDLAEHAGHFRGREWLFDRIGHWLTGEESRLMLLTAPPGYGKSAVCAKLTTEFDVLGIHFCRSTRMRSCEPAPWVMGLVRQLAGQLEPYRREIAKIASPDLTDARSLFRDLVADPLERCTSQLGVVTPRLFVVDGLDEAEAVKGPALTDVIIESIPHLPHWLRVLVTCRPDHPLTTRFRTVGTTCVELESEDPRNLMDLAGFIAERLGQESEAMAAGAQVDLVRRLTAEAAGNFLFASVSMEALTDPDPKYRLTPEEIGSLPGKLHGLYHLMFRKRFPDLREYEGIVGPILDCLSAAKGPLPADTLGPLCGLGTREVRRGLRTVSQFLTNSPGGLSFFHKSLAEWLADEKASAEFAADTAEGGKRLYLDCLRQHGQGGAQMSIYALRYVVSHVCEEGSANDLRPILTDPVYLERFVAEFGIGELLHALSLVSGWGVERSASSPVLSADDPFSEAVALLSRALQLSGRALVADPRQFPAQLTARLWSVENPLLADLLGAIAGRMSDRLRPLRSPLAKPDSPLLLAVRPHVADLRWAHLLPDRTRILTLGSDGEFKTWDAETGTVLTEARIPLDGQLVGSPVLSRDCSRLAINCGVCVIVWDIAAGVACAKVGFPARPEANPGSPLVVGEDLAGTGPGFRSLQVRGNTPGDLRDQHRANRLWLTEDLRQAAALIHFERSGDAQALFSSMLVTWDLQNSANPPRIAAVPPETSFFCISDDGRYAAIGADEYTIEVRLLDTGSVLRAVPLPWTTKKVEALYFDQSALMMTLADYTTYELNFMGAKDPAPAVSEVPIRNGRTVDGRIYVKQGESRSNPGQGLLRLRGTTAEFGTIELADHVGEPLSMLGRGRLLSRFGNEVILTDTATGQEILRFTGHSGSITSASWSTDESLLLTGSEDNTIRLWRLTGGRTSTTAADAPDIEQALVVHQPDGRVIRSLGGELSIWDPARENSAEAVAGYEGFLGVFASSSDGLLLATGSDQGDILIWDTSNWTIAHSLSGRGPNVEGLWFLPGDSQLAAATAGGTICIWSIADRKIVARYEVPATSRIALASVNGRARLALSDELHRVCVIDALSGDCHFTCAGHKGPVIRIDSTPDGTRLVTGSTDGTIRVWNAENGSPQRAMSWVPEVLIPLNILSPHKRIAGAVARARVRRKYGGAREASPDDNFFVIGQDCARLMVPTAEHGIIVWSLETGAVLHELSGHGNRISSICSLAGSTRIVSSSYDQFIRLWDLESGELLDAFMVDAPISAAVTNAGGRFVVAGDTSGKQHVVEIPRPTKT